MITVRRVAANVGLVAVGLVVALGAAELLLRAFWPQKSYSSVGMFEPDADAGYRLREGYRNEVRVPEYRTRIVIDNAGYRVPVDEPPEPLGASRVLAIGDSFTFGVGVEASEAFPEALEQDMEDRWPGAWVVRNGGVGGYGPLRSAHHLFATQGDWRPDIVVHVVYVGNDLEDPRPETFPADPIVRSGRIITNGTHPLMRLRLALRARLHLYAFLRKHAYELYITTGLARRSQYLDPIGLRTWPERIEAESWPAGRAAIESIRDWCHERGTRYLVVLAPARWQVEEDSWRRYRSAWGGGDDRFERDHAQRVIYTHLSEAGVEVLDLLGDMRTAAAAGEVLYHRRDPHWNARGHELAASVTRERLLEAGWIRANGDPRRAVARSSTGRSPG